MPLSPARRGLVLAAVLLAAPAAGAEPLRAVIDAELKAAWQREKVTPAPRADDSAFLRRVYLDLVGTAPAYDETTAFLADTDPKKREKLVDKLLADPRFGVAQAHVWDQVLFGRHPGGGDTTRKRDIFKAWLAKQFAGNVPYDVWVNELLLAETPGPEMYYAQFRNQPEEATIQVSRTFLGTQLGCAKCHDHPFDVWTQKDFYGMTGFFVRLVVQDTGTGMNKTVAIAEKSTGEVLFSGTAKDQGPGKKGDPVKPKFLGGPELAEPPVPKDFKEPMGAKLPKPLFSRKAKLAAWAAAADNPYFAKAAANRVWAQFMGRGIVHPVDDFTAKNEPSHPALLKAMTDGLVANKFDLKWLIREVVNSEAYQLAATGPVTDALPKWFERARVRPLSAEELMASLRAVTAYDADAKAAAAKLPNAAEEYILRYFGEPTNGLGEFQGGLSEHLFLNNAEQVRMFARRKPGNLADKLLAPAESADSKVERLYLSVLQRRPREKERAAFAAHLGRGAKPEAAVEDVIWVLLNSSEFRFNH
jgi:hypothetical protein